MIWFISYEVVIELFKERIRRANELRRAATRAFIGEHQNISNKNATLRKINSNNRLPSNYTEHAEIYSHDTKPSLWRKPLGQIGPVIRLKVGQGSADQAIKNILGTDGPNQRRKRGKLSFEIVQFCSKSPEKKNSHETKNKATHRTRYATFEPSILANSDRPLWRIRTVHFETFRLPLYIFWPTTFIRKNRSL